MLKLIIAALLLVQGTPAKAVKNLLAPDLIEKSEWKEKLQMGNPDSHNEIYIITDWLCPACQKKEPELEKMLPKLLQNSRVYFIDLANHPGSADFVKYNLAFLLNNKSDYLKLRPILNTFSQKGKLPTDEDINAALAPLHIKYTPLSESDINSISNYFISVASSLKSKGTPTIVLKNEKTHKTKSFLGISFTETDILKSLEEIEKP